LPYTGHVKVTAGLYPPYPSKQRGFRSDYGYWMRTTLTELLTVDGGRIAGASTSACAAIFDTRCFPVSLMRPKSFHEQVCPLRRI
jgi:hypothetical protein